MTKRISHRTLPAAVAICVCLLAAGCSSSTSKNPATNTPSAPGSTSVPANTTGSSVSSSSGSSQPAAVASITIKNFDFTVSGTAAAGSMVQVTNNDSETHSVTADNGKAFDVTIQPGKTASFAAPKEGGSYKFHCNFHSNMHDTLTVAK